MLFARKKTLLTETLQTIGSLAHARSGDKGDKVNIGVLARSSADYERLKQVLTAEKVKEFFADVCKGPVLRYELDNLEALNFVLHETLSGGATLSLRSDAQGKTFAARLLSMACQ